MATLYDALTAAFPTREGLFAMLMIELLGIGGGGGNTVVVTPNEDDTVDFTVPAEGGKIDGTEIVVTENVENVDLQMDGGVTANENADGTFDITI